ncbi:MAG: polyphenol oxidase family protein [Caldilineaceae bacterium]|nr:polyphenol oxidase family protein [Caldilineaceae bacterium]
MQLTKLPNGLPAYQFDLLADWPVGACVSTRTGGVSEPPFDSLNFSTRRGDSKAAVGTNIERFSRACGFRREDLVWAGQIRSDAVCEATDVHRGTRLAGTDGLVTSEVRLPLMTLYADCVPIVIYDTVHHRLGVAHAGWQGTVKRIAERLLQQLGRRYGTVPADCVAGLGPSIGPDSYEIGDDVIQLVRTTQDDAASLLRPSARGQGVLRSVGGQPPTTRGRGCARRQNRGQRFGHGCPARHVFFPSGGARPLRIVRHALLA